MFSPTRLPTQVFSSFPRVVLVSVIVGIVLFAAGPVDFAEKGGAAPAAAQDDNCDSNRCLIWGVGLGGASLLKIDTCTGAVATFFFPAGTPAVNTVATIPAGPPYPQLIYGVAAGGSLCSIGFPPTTLGPCSPGVVAASRGLALGDSDATAANGGFFYAGNDIPALGSLHDPGALIGSGGLGYGGIMSDLVCDPSGKWGFMGEVDLGGGAPGNNALVQVSRGNGFQSFPRPPAGRGNEFSGLAYDGHGRLWGGTTGGGGLQRIDPKTGIGILIWPGVPGLWDLASNECTPGCPSVGTDLGDAPDSTTHSPNTTMTAYPGVNADFPVVKDLNTGTPPGPFHRLLPDSVLGEDVTDEKDADLLPDADGVTNIEPPTNTSDRDGADDGVQFPISLPQCQLTQFSYVMTVVGPVRDRYVNVWFDFDRNGAWGDVLQCSHNGQVYTVSEWAVVDQLTQVGTGVHILTTPLFRSVDPDEDLWMRITLAETTAPAADGRGYDHGYELGETEDYLILPIGSSEYQ